MLSGATGGDLGAWVPHNDVELHCLPVCLAVQVQALPQSVLCSFADAIRSHLSRRAPRSCVKHADLLQPRLYPNLQVSS
jgi:hypothetical protein